MIERREFLRVLLAAPVIIRTPGLLMPVRPLPDCDLRVAGDDRSRLLAMFQEWLEADYGTEDNIVLRDHGGAWIVRDGIVVPKPRRLFGLLPA